MATFPHNHQWNHSQRWQTNESYQPPLFLIPIHSQLRYQGSAFKLYHTIPTFNNPKGKALWKHWGKRRKCWLPAFSPFSTMFPTLHKTKFNFNDSLSERPFENIVRKGENAGNQHFHLFPQYFLFFTKQSSIFESHLFCCLQMLSIWTGPKSCRSVKV